MDDIPTPGRLSQRFWTACLRVFAGTVLLVLTIRLIACYWKILTLIILVVVVCGVLVWLWHRRSTWR